MSSLTHAALRRNVFVQPEPVRIYMPDTALVRPSALLLSPGAALVYRLTRRQPETCATIAALAGFPEMEG